MTRMQAARIISILKKTVNNIFYEKSKEKPPYFFSQYM